MDFELPNVWKASNEQLAKLLGLVAGAQPGDFTDVLREEAQRIHATWLDSFQLPDKHDPKHMEEQERKAGIQASLRKRTIEILVKAEQQANA